jgi:hypothetical protein
MGIPIIGDLINGVKDLISEVVVDKDKRDQVNLELRRLEDQAEARLDAQMTAQVEVNKIEAASGSVFVAGWRPAIGWVGASALFYSYIVSPFIGIWTKVPPYDFDGLIYIVTAMLGIGGMRSYEKVKGVSTNNYTDVPKSNLVSIPDATVTTEITTEVKPSTKKRHFRL